VRTSVETVVLGPREGEDVCCGVCRLVSRVWWQHCPSTTHGRERWESLRLSILVFSVDLRRGPRYCLRPWCHYWQSSNHGWQVALRPDSRPVHMVVSC